MDNTKHWFKRNEFGTQKNKLFKGDFLCWQIILFWENNARLLVPSKIVAKTLSEIHNKEYFENYILYCLRINIFLL